MEMLLNIDVPDLGRAEAFYCAAFGLTVGRRMGKEVLELLGGPMPIYLLRKAEGSAAVPGKPPGRSYERHWCPIHLDLVVPDIEAAAARALAAGATLEKPIESADWGRLAVFGDPFGHGFCLVQFTGRGYDELTVP